MDVLYADDVLAVCLKPVGALSEDKGGNCVPALLRQTLGAPAYCVHRLDRAVGGVMVLSLCDAWTGKLTQRLQEGGEKEYLAVVSGDPGDTGTYTDWLYHDPKANKTFVVQRQRRGVRQAELTFQRMQTAHWNGQPLSLVRVRLHTGRTHQIRTQFASRGMPLVGDRKYGSRIAADIALWSYEIAFDHPQTNRRVAFHHAPPERFPFDLFGKDTAAE